MAKLPSYMKVVDSGKNSGVLTFSVRKWHPGYWLLLVKTLASVRIAFSKQEDV